VKPPNEKGTLLHVPIPNLLLAKEYHFPCSTQACFQVWNRERDRLLALYLKTRSPRHWKAYCLHIAGMAARKERSEQ
jgi:hypothetical protein